MALTQNKQSNPFPIMSRLLSRVRPSVFKRRSQTLTRMKKEIELISADSAKKVELLNELNVFFETIEITDLLSELGSHTPGADFSGEFFKRMSHILLPPLAQSGDLTNAIKVLSRSSDLKWLADVGEEDWLQFIQLTEFQLKSKKLRTQLFESLILISHRIVSYTFVSDLQNSLAFEKTIGFNSFLKLNHAVSILSESIDSINELQVSSESQELIQQILSQCKLQIKNCRAVIQGVHERKKTTGTSLDLNFAINRIENLTDRLELIIHILFPKNEWEAKMAGIKLCKQIFELTFLQNSFSDLLGKNVESVALQVTEHVASTGEHYVTSNRNEYFDMLWSAARGGFIVAFLCVIKAAISLQKLPPGLDALLTCLNYSFGFMLIHAVQGTLATKQPAMTASTIAAEIKNIQSNSTGYAGLASLISKVSRSQFIAVLGNFLVALPVALLLILIINFFSETDLLDSHKALSLINDIHLTESNSILFACIAGVWLFLSGIISGWIDNVYHFRRVSERLKNLFIFKATGRWGERIIDYLSQNSGVLAGNFLLGFMLGLTPFLAQLFGLPISIRHITFSSGNLGLAIAQLGVETPPTLAIYAFLGVIFIGFCNLLVSFSLALWIALKSQRVNQIKMSLLAKLLFKKLTRSPLDFIRPPG